MPPVWLRPEAGGAWAYFPSVADATVHLKEQGIELFATQVSRAAKNGKTRNGWEFRSTSLDADVPSLPATSEDMAPDSGQRQGGVLTFFTPASELAACGCCGDKLLGDIVSCPGCGQQVHALCTQGAKCFRCVCRVCNSPLGDTMRPCKSCKHRVHVACTVQVPYRVEVTCKVCAPKLRLSPRPRKKQVKRRFNPQWKVGRPWLHFENGVMSCLACRAYPQMGLQNVWLDGTPQVRKRAVVVAMALWESGGASATVIGGLPLPVHQAIFGLFHLVYRLVKRYGCFSQLAADAETATLVGGQVAPAYRSRWAAREIAHAIARPIRAAGGELVRQSAFFALASDSSTDRAANKQELVYTRTMRAGRSHTAFLGLQDLQAGTAIGIVAAYKAVMLRAGLPVEEWIGRVFWYCADGAAVMQSTGNGFCGLLQNLQTEVLGQAVLVPVHANCHRADLAFREAMDGSHVFLDHVGETTTAVVAWYRNAPTRLRNLRRRSQALHISPLQYTAEISC